MLTREPWGDGRPTHHYSLPLIFVGEPTPIQGLERGSKGLTFSVDVIGLIQETAGKKMQ